MMEPFKLNMMEPRTLKLNMMEPRTLLNHTTTNAGMVEPLILVVDDDDDFRDYLCDELRREHGNVVPVRDAVAAMAYIDTAFEDSTNFPLPSLIITDVRMPRITGLKLAAYAHFIPTIVMSAFIDDATNEAAQQIGARFVFDKPFDMAEMCAAAKLALS